MLLLVVPAWCVEQEYIWWVRSEGDRGGGDKLLLLTCRGSWTQSRRTESNEHTTEETADSKSNDNRKEGDRHGRKGGDLLANRNRTVGPVPNYRVKLAYNRR
jgi:hypothetical protein